MRELDHNEINEVSGAGLINIPPGLLTIPIRLPVPAYQIAGPIFPLPDVPKSISSDINAEMQAMQGS